MRTQKNIFQMKEQDKTSGGKTLNETEISNLPDNRFKVTLIRMLTVLGRRMEEHSEAFKKELENTQVPNRA